MKLIDAADLPKSVSAGPMAWSEALSARAETVHDVDRLINSNTSAETGLIEAYDRRIADIEKATGQRLENPLREAERLDFGPRQLRAELWGARSVDRGLYAGPPMPSARQLAIMKFSQNLNELEARFPESRAAIRAGVPIGQDVQAQMREAAAADTEAARAPELGTLGNFAASLWGSMRAAVKDPVQLSAIFLGPGAATGRTVAGRIGQTMLAEGLLNGAQEAVLQAASQDRKRAAGVEHGMADALKNVGIATIVGGLFGGLVQGGGEIARVLKFAEGGAERTTRILEGRPEPGDVDGLAADLGMPLSPDRKAMLDRSFDERALDDATLRPDASVNEKRVYEAALRHADDPDNFPEPEIIERIIADEGQVPKRSLRADEYQRIYDGDIDAIDNFRMTRPADAREGMSIEDTFDADPVAGQTIRPERPFEPEDDAALTQAEHLAGELTEPVLRMDGMPENLFDLIPIEDGDGNVRLMHVTEALAMADENDVIADILEKCAL